jgi:O-acetyl-ADP-ribose deacetylase (regulator of RNase III)
MLLVKKHSLNSVSFPAISAGVYSYPKKEAAEIAINTVLEFMKNEGYIVDVYFVLYDNDNYLIYKTILDGLKK